MWLKAIIFLGFVMSIDDTLAITVLTLEYGQLIFIPILIVMGQLLFLLTGGFIAKFTNASPFVQKIISASCLFLIAILNFLEII